MINAVPRKVLQSAAELGVHNDCIAASWEGMCEACSMKMVHVMDLHYSGYGSPIAATEAYIADLRAEA